MKYFLILTNIVCVILHLVFEFYIYAYPSEYTGFILVENMLVTALLGVMAILVYKSDSNPRYLVYNVIFWIFLVINLLIFRPEKTTLVIVGEYMPVKQWMLLSTLGVINIIVNLLACNKIRKRCEEHRESI